MPSFTIQTSHGQRLIGDGHPVFIIAEMSSNHQQSYEKAVAIVKAAAEAGADAIKLQTYLPETITIDCNNEWFNVGGGDNPKSWSQKNLFSLYKQAYTPREWHQKLQKIAEDLGLLFFSTPFSTKDVDFLETLNVPLYKIASYEVTDIPLITRIAKTRKPVIMSIGFASIEEVELAIKTLRENGTTEIAILHCVTAYSNNPKPEETNLQTMLDIKKKFDVVAGFSDNNSGNEIPLQAAMMGASIIEKHIVADEEQTFDSLFSVNPTELKEFVIAVRKAEVIRGKVNYGTQSSTEEYNKRYRKSIFVVKDIKKGDHFSAENIGVIRPAFGMEPKYYEKTLGKTALRDIDRGTPLRKEMISNDFDYN